MCTVSPSQNHNWWTPREPGPEASTKAIDLGVSGTEMSNSSNPAGRCPCFLRLVGTAMTSPTVSSELERMWLSGRSVCTTILGARGSETSTAVKFFGALSCASQRMRRPSLAIWIDMPSPIPPKPLSS